MPRHQPLIRREIHFSVPYVFMPLSMRSALVVAGILLSASYRSVALTRPGFGSLSGIVHRQNATPMTRQSLSASDEEAYKKAAGQEVIEIVDINNNVLEPKMRSVMRAEGLIHRATYALVRDSQNYFYVQRRSTIKDYCPGFFDPTPGGVVGAGESYDDTNRREVEEEMGIPESTPMAHLFDFYYEDQRIKCWGDCWEIVYDGPLRLQTTEVDAVEKMSMQEILDRYEAGEKFTPDSIAACKEYVKRKGCPEVTSDKPTLPHIEFY